MVSTATTQPAGRLARVFTQLWDYRHFIVSGALREMRARYTGSLLGGVWAILAPLSMILIYTFVFSQVMRARLPGVETAYAYSVFLCAGLLPWQAFNEVLARCQNIFTDNANLIKKARFPRLCLPATVALGALFNFAIILLLFLGFLVIAGLLPGKALLAIVPLFLLQTLFALGIGIALGVIHVFFRDVGQMVSIGLQLWFWATPIVYPVAIIPEGWRWLIELNPMYYFADSWQQLFLSDALPGLSRLAVLGALAGAALLVGLFLHQRHGAYIVDEL